MHKFFVLGIRQQYQQEDRNQRFQITGIEDTGLIGFDKSYGVDQQ